MLILIKASCKFKLIRSQEESTSGLQEVHWAERQYKGSHFNQQKALRKATFRWVKDKSLFSLTTDTSTVTFLSLSIKGISRKDEDLEDPAHSKAASDSADFPLRLNVVYSSAC